MLDRFGLADHDMQRDQNDTDGKRQPVKSQRIHPLQQQGAGDDDERIGEDELFILETAPHADRIDADHRQHQYGGL